MCLIYEFEDVAAVEKKFRFIFLFQRALELVEKSLRAGKGDKRVSYLAGNAGSLALGAVLHNAAGNDEEFRGMISKLAIVTVEY